MQRRIVLLVTLVFIAVAFAVGGCDSAPDLVVEEASAEAAPASTSPAPTNRPAGLAEIPGDDGELPAGHPPIDGDGTGLPPVDPMAGTADDALSWSTPDGWEAQPPSNSMRRAQYRVPGESGDAECIVFYFGPGQGGEPMANAERWATQLAGADGAPAPMETEQLTVGSVDVLRVEVRGTYNAGTMAGMQGQPQPGSMLLGAIAAGPDANWFFKLTGPEATVEANEAAFDEMIGSLGGS